MSKYRKRMNRFLAEGERCVEQILENRKIMVESVLLLDDSTDTGRFRHDEVPAYTLSAHDFGLITDTQSPQGVAAVCVIPDESAAGQLAGTGGLIAAMDAIQDPGNLGTMIRTASWFGATGILLGEGTADPFHPKVVRSTAGATGILPYRKGPLSKELAELEKAGYRTCLLDGGEDAISIKQVKPHQKTVLVVGNEANGISSSLFTNGRIPVRIDGHEEYVESLNAAIALSIGLWHFAG
nr:RNA methyltransferase [Rhodohalobacter mucosus]